MGGIWGARSRRGTGRKEKESGERRKREKE
jgi:hypothetical protein